MKKREITTSVLLIILAVALIVAGVWLTIRDRMDLTSDEVVYLPFDEGFDPARVTGIRAELIDSELHIYTGSDENIEIQTDGEGLSVREEHGQIVISQHHEHGSQIFTGKENASVVIWLPAGYAGAITAGLGSGDVNVNGLDTPGLDLDITCASGEISVYSAVFGTLTLHTASGDIWMGSDTVAGELDLTSVSGEISVYGTEAEGISAVTTSGEIWISAPLTDSLRASSTSGDVTVALTGGPEEYEVRCTTTSGRVTGGREAVDGPKKVTVTTTSGDVMITFDAETQ